VDLPHRWGRRARGARDVPAVLDHAGLRRGVRHGDGPREAPRAAVDRAEADPHRRGADRGRGAHPARVESRRHGDGGLMIRAIALTLLIVGVIVAAASAARNGPRHVNYRGAEAVVAAIRGASAAVE